METKILSGGSMNKVEKIGEAVHKTTKGNAAMVRKYLLYLEKKGMTGVPRFLGIDAQRRDIFSYLPGKTMGPDYPADHPCLHSDQTIYDTAQFMRKLHDISIGFLSTAMEDGWANPYFPHGPYETICHGDAASWNFVFVNDRIAGLFDFDQAYPGTRYWDLASTLSMAAFPFYFDYDPSKHANKAKRQIKLFFNAYGMPRPSNLIEIVIDRIQRDFCDDAVARAAAGDEECIKMLKRGDVDHYQRFIVHLKKHGHEWM
ncbi:MAG: aminoglycoside phosphotransferase family protein [Defluviitaleaceae bacterium]|nr:aminoglycoside phosphotransferase family protein [Defluviitaleaceae bacterium]